VVTFMRRNCLTRLFARWSAEGAFDLSTERDDLARGTGALLRSSLPPVSEGDEGRINTLTLYYAAAAGRPGVGLLEDIDALKHKSGDYWLWRIRPVRRLLGLRRRRRTTYRYYDDLEGTFWALKELEGRDKETAIETAAVAAFSHPDEAVRMRARRYLAENAPERLKRLGTENIPRLTQRERGRLLTLCIERFGDDPAVAAMARAVAKEAESASAKLKPLAYLVTEHRDGEAFDELVEMSTDANIPNALDALSCLARAYRRDNSIGDVPGLLKKRLVEFAALEREAPDDNREGDPIPDMSILKMLGQAGGKGSLAVLKEALEGELANVEPSAAVWPIADKWPAETAGPVLVGFLESRPMRDWGDTERQALNALQRRHCLDALPVLERFFAMELPGADPTAIRHPESALWERTGDPLERLRLTILGLRIRSAADPVASFRAVDERDRPAVGEALVKGRSRKSTTEAP
jgi:hypothetical protein